MAYFAKLDENNIVTEIIVINNLELDSNNEEESGLAWLESWSGGYTNWKQTSYNATFRKHYAGIGYKYDQTLDAFIPPKPYNSWILNEETYLWDPPTPYPTDNRPYIWVEEDLNWQVITE